MANHRITDESKRRIRRHFMITRGLLERFVAHCQAQNKSASAEIRRLIEKELKIKE